MSYYRSRYGIDIICNSGLNYSLLRVKPINPDEITEIINVIATGDLKKYILFIYSMYTIMCMNLKYIYI